MTDPLDHLRLWVGRKEAIQDLATAWPAAAMSATLDRHDAPLNEGDAIPEGWHWLYFLETAPASELAHDGHPKRGGFLPPVTLPRRMWAGGRLEFRRPIRIGERMSRESEIISVEPKSGSSGSLLFVTVRHTVTVSNQIAVVEEHDIVYREAAQPGARATPGAHTTPGAGAAPGKPAPANPVWRHEVMPDEAMLFRYSALIFNAHRIHYDLDYCRREEGYPGLIVHGPLQTTLLLDLCRRNAGKPVRKLDYRAVSPLFHNEKISVGGILSADGASAQVWTAGPTGHIAMTGTVQF
jgi:3-methylfumaryl-CoA hydratase